MLISELKYTTIALAPVIYDNQKLPQKLLQNSNKLKQEPNTKKISPLNIFLITATTMLTAVGIKSAITKPKKDVETIAQKALSDAANGNFYIKSPEERYKSLYNSLQYKNEKLDGTRTSQMLIDFLNSDVSNFQHHAYNIFSEMEHDKAITILKPFLENRNLKFNRDRGTNLRAQIFKLIAEKGTSKDIELIQQYLNPEDEWYKPAKNALNKIVERGV